MHARCADMRLQCSYSTTSTLLTTRKTSLQCQCDPSGWHHTVDRAQCSRTTRQDVPHVIEDIIYYF
jgi:hypothetical protein